MTRIRPYFGTLSGAVLGVAAIVIWALTFEGHGGIEHSRYLFPLSRPILERIYPAQDIPASIWFGIAFIQWLLLGVLLD